MANIDPTLIDRFESGGRKLRESIAGLSLEDLMAFPVPGTWSIQQIVVHLQDSDAVAIDRMKRVAAEAETGKTPPLLVAFDENLWVERLAYDAQSAQDAAALFDLNRRQFAKVLRRLPDGAWDRYGVHNVNGKVTLRDLLQTYVNHLEHHLKFILEKRAKVGKAM